VVVDYHPEFVSEKRGSLSIHVVRTLAKELIPIVAADPDHLFDALGCDIIKDQRKVKVARVQIKIQGNVKTIYVKRYNMFSWRHRFGSFFQSSGAVRSLKGAAVLAQAGISTGSPLAAVESRSWGLLNKSFFLSEEIEGGKTTDMYWREELLAVKGKEGMGRRKRFLEGLGKLFRSLHDQDVYHNDLKDANILVRLDFRGAAEHFYLLDLEGIRRYPKLNRRRQIKNLVQLNRTLGKYLRTTDKLRFLESYLGPSFSNRVHKRTWVARVLKESHRLDRLRNVRTSAVGITGKAAHEA
jgi:tRNA A-37 threonylcarbamoyl transferase component Bud32